MKITIRRWIIFPLYCFIYSKVTTSYFPHAICREILQIKKKSEKRDGFSLANHDLMSHSASEIDSGAIRRVNYTLVIARCERARARDGLSVRKMTMYSGARECVVVVTYTVKRFRFAPWDNLRRSLPSASPVVSLYFSLPLSLSVFFFSLYLSLSLSLAAIPDARPRVRM